MGQDSTEQQLRRFFLGTAAAIFLITPAELILLEHTEELLQWIPFVVCGVGLIATFGVWFGTTHRTLQVFRWIMAAVVLSSFVGMWLHFSRNLAFTREINPSYSLMEALWPAIKGSYPLLAPGVLLLAGVLGIAATYRHPLLKK
jgi:ABC-type proline/glycine betaine transport system permease subunit